MRIHEPECVALKRRGAKYVSQMLSGKTQQEQLEFWKERTNRLISHNKRIKGTANSVAVSRLPGMAGSPSLR